MKKLKEAIVTRGRALNNDVLMVDTFLNHQVDPELLCEAGEVFADHFKDAGIDRVLTIESSGIVPAVFTARALGVPLVIMKKQSSKIMNENLIQTTVRSFTKAVDYQLTVKRDFLPAGEHMLLIDDFLAFGEAAIGVYKLVQEAKATLSGIGIVIEKSFQPGRSRIEELNVPLFSLARVKYMEPGRIVFEE